MSTMLDAHPMWLKDRYQKLMTLNNRLKTKTLQRPKSTPVQPVKAPKTERLRTGDMRIEGGKKTSYGGKHIPYGNKTPKLFDESEKIEFERCPEDPNMAFFLSD
jgi:hypothetical protein